MNRASGDRGQQTATEAPKAGVTLKGAGWLALNVFVPVSDTARVLRYTGRNATRLWTRLRDVTSGRVVGDYRPADWAQAVADSGLSPAQLRRNFRLNLFIWWGLMWLTGLPAAGFLLMLMAAGRDVNATGWLRIVSVLLALGAISATGFVQALAMNYRLWQLEEKRVSASEKGSFRDFLNETKWCRRVLSAGMYQ
ncbi:conjugal transfer protein TraX [Rahnella sp. BCC 1045]|uniref:conjugal transfer protein TraX n=1 Tax=Rahnella sp. BCC 1045 TaxID=2816251 RepID=UPI001C25EEB2|nr:conjugal transfer protein TraX [Rahnella sp. BCC 1045]MBU9819655.1 conjugal transfer protein TraX [Rahnella sp. BCC 1045]